MNAFIDLYDAATEAHQRLRVATRLIDAYENAPSRTGGYDLRIADEQLQYCLQLLETAIAAADAEQKTGA